MKFGIIKENKLKKLILFILVLTVSTFAQQLNHTFGYNATSGTAMTGKIDNADESGALDYTILLDIADYYWVDPNPLFAVDTSSSDSTTQAGYVYNNSDRVAFGTLYTYFDCQNATDSTRFTIKAHAGQRGTTNESYAGIKWHPTAVTLETVDQKGDYMSVQNVYVGSTYYKHFPPEYIKIVYDAITTGASCSDSVDIYYRYVYPAIYQVHKERIPQ